MRTGFKASHLRWMISGPGFGPLGPSVTCLLLLLIVAVYGPSAAAESLDPLPPKKSDAGQAVSAVRLASPADRSLQEGPVDAAEYVLGPGDVLSVDVWGAAKFGFLLYLDSEGRVFVPDSGPLTLAGMTLEDARILVTSTVRSAIRQGQVDVRLVTLRQFKIHVTGEVENPGSYFASAAMRVSELLDNIAEDTYVPGLTDSSSLRNIELRRSDRRLRVDLVSFSLAGDVSANPFVLDGDVLYVPRVKHSFSVSGGVMFPGVYELVEGEKLSQVLHLVGGVTPDADLEKGEIGRLVDGERTESIYFRLGSVLNGESDFEIEDGDRISVRTPTHFRERHQVYVGGEVVFPGWYPMNRGEDTLSGLLARAGGLTDDADVGSARIMRPDSSAGGRIARVETDFARLSGGRSAYNVLLEPGDRIEIPRKTGFVLVSGEVRRPGHVPYVPNKRASFYIREAGGLTRQAAGSKILVKRFATGQSLAQGEAGHVRPSDEVLVPARPEGARWSIVKDTVAILAQIATIYIVVDQVVGD
jgi:polysaccharide export outer membrane protein